MIIKYLKNVELNTKHSVHCSFWNILTKNLVTFKRWDGVKDEKL